MFQVPDPDIKVVGKGAGIARTYIYHHIKQKHVSLKLWH